MGREAEGFRQWAASVDQTGGEPEKAADLILSLMNDEASAV